MESLTIKGVTFEYCPEWNLYLKKDDTVTPIWKRGKCVMLLITRRKTGKAFYVNVNTRELTLYVNVNILWTPHGITYQLHSDTYISVLSAGFYEQI